MWPWNIAVTTNITAIANIKISSILFVLTIIFTLLSNYGFSLFHRYCAVQAGFGARAASGARRGVPYQRMLVDDDIHLAQRALAARFNALPAGFAFRSVQPDVFRFMDVARALSFHCYLHAC